MSQLICFDWEMRKLIRKKHFHVMYKYGINVSLSRNAIFYVLYYDTEHTSLIIDDDALNETVFCDNLDTVVNEMIQ